MVKSKVKQGKSGKKPSSKYGKLLVVATKELSTKKKALIQAERNLAKVKQTHEELIREVARLDMVERSLKALVDGTEPPTNIKYIYQYPPWVYTPYYTVPYIPNTLTLTTPPTPQSGGYYLNGNWQSPIQNLQMGQSVCTQNADMSFFNSTGGVSSTTMNTCSVPSTLTMTTPSLTSSSTLTTVATDSTITSGIASCSNNMSWSNGQEGLVIDLTTHAEPTEDAIMAELKPSAILPVQGEVSEE
jgi:hypothetical protein